MRPRFQPARQQSVKGSVGTASPVSARRGAARDDLGGVPGVGRGRWRRCRCRCRRIDQDGLVGAAVEGEVNGALATALGCAATAIRAVAVVDEIGRSGRRPKVRRGTRPRPGCRCRCRRRPRCPVGRIVRRPRRPHPRPGSRTSARARPSSAGRPPPRGSVGSFRYRSAAAHWRRTLRRWRSARRKPAARGSTCWD